MSRSMQIASGTRAVQIYLAQKIDDNISIAETFNVTTSDFFSDREVDMWIEFLSVNLRDQTRREDFVTDGAPVQFLSDAADCRIFYTTDTLSNYSQLWRYAVRAIGDPSSLCVKGSTGFSYTTATGSTASSPPLHPRLRHPPTWPPPSTAPPTNSPIPSPPTLNSPPSNPPPARASPCAPHRRIKPVTTTGTGAHSVNASRGRVCTAREVSTGGRLNFTRERVPGIARQVAVSWG